MKCSSGPRGTASGVSESLNHQLNMYVLAASAAGVGVLALSPTVEAKIIYTPTNTPIIGSIQLDLNHDGINDFEFYATSYFTSSRSFGGLQVRNEYGGKNQIRGMRTHRGGSESYAAALRAGAVIGRKGAFTRTSEPTTMIQEGYNFRNHTRAFRGFWANGGKGVKNRYLGLKFFIKGKVHFGWARVTVTVNPFPAGTLTGYAYETIPGKAIIAGNIIAGATKGPDDVEPTASLNTPTPEPTTLGMLALGAPGLSIWRRKESAVAAVATNL